MIEADHQGNNPREQRDPAAVEQAGEEVPPLLVGAEPVPRRSQRLQSLDDGSPERVVTAQEGRGDGGWAALREVMGVQECSGRFRVKDKELPLMGRMLP